MSDARYGRSVGEPAGSPPRPAARRVGPCPVGRPMKESRFMNKVLLAGRLTRDPEMRALASGKHVTQFSVLVFRGLADRLRLCRTCRHTCSVSGRG